MAIEKEFKAATTQLHSGTLYYVVKGPKKDHQEDTRLSSTYIVLYKKHIKLR